MRFIIGGACLLDRPRSDYVGSKSRKRKVWEKDVEKLTVLDRRGGSAMRKRKQRPGRCRPRPDI